MSVSVIYHGGCADGMGAAFAAWYHFQLFKPKGSFIHTSFYPGFYGKPIPEEAYDADKIYFVDYSLPREEMIALMSKHDITVIDHHDSAQKNLEGLDNCIFDMKQSGAMLTWKYFAEQRNDTWIPDLFRYIQDRDLWKNELPNTVEINNVIFMMPTDATGTPDKIHSVFCRWSNLMNDLDMPGQFRAAIIAQGEILEQSNRRYIDNIKKLAQKGLIRLHTGEEYELPIVNAHYTNISTILNELSEESESGLAMSYYIDEQDMYKYSIRGKTGNQINLGQLVGKIAGEWKLLSSGGHPNAAGFVARGPVHTVKHDQATKIEFESIKDKIMKTFQLYAAIQGKR